MAVAAGEFERIGGARRGDVDFGRGFCVGRGSDVTFSKMKLAVVGDVLLRQQQIDLLQALAEARDGFVGRYAEAPEFMRQEGASKTDVEAAMRDSIEHRYLAGKLERVVEHRQTAPVTSRMVLVRCAAAARNKIGFGL